MSSRFGTESNATSPEAKEFCAVCFRQEVPLLLLVASCNYGGTIGRPADTEAEPEYTKERYVLWNQASRGKINGQKSHTQAKAYRL